MTDQNPTQALLTAILEEVRQLRRESRAAALLGDYGYRWTPDGLPICPKHGEVMTRREKQGDTWYSHRLIDPATGEELYCRGHEGKHSPGWYSGDPTPPAPLPPCQGGAGGVTPVPASQSQPRPAQAQPKPITPPPSNAPAESKARHLAAPVRDARLTFYEIGSAAMTAGKISVDKFNGLVNKANRDGFAAALHELQAVAV